MFISLNCQVSCIKQACENSQTSENYNSLIRRVCGTRDEERQRTRQKKKNKKNPSKQGKGELGKNGGRAQVIQPCENETPQVQIMKGIANRQRFISKESHLKLTDCFI